MVLFVAYKTMKKWGDIRVWKDYLIATVAPIGIYLARNESLNIKLTTVDKTPLPKKNANYGAGSTI